MFVNQTINRTIYDHASIPCKEKLTKNVKRQTVQVSFFKPRSPFTWFNVASIKFRLIKYNIHLAFVTSIFITSCFNKIDRFSHSALGGRGERGEGSGETGEGGARGWVCLVKILWGDAMFQIENTRNTA